MDREGHSRPHRLPTSRQESCVLTPSRTASSQAGRFGAAGPQILPSTRVQTSKPRIPYALDCRPHPSQCKFCTVKKK